MATIHLLLQGKGGGGKSFVASILYQYFEGREMPVFGYETDPVNATFAGYKEFYIKLLNIMKGDDIDPRRFDQLIEQICLLDTEGAAPVVVDNGASCFLALCSYLKENDALAILKDQGHETVIHTLVTGGQALGDTLSGLKALTEHFSDVPLVVWINPYYGEIVSDGHRFFDLKVGFCPYNNHCI